MCSPFFASNTDNVESKTGRAYLFFWFMVNFILTASYTASLTSFLVDENIQISLPGFRRQWKEPDAWRSLPTSLAECYRKEKGPCMATSLGGNTESILKGYLQTDKTHYKSHTSNPVLSPHENYDLLLQDQVDGILAWAADETTVDYAIQSQDDETQCNWLQVGDVFAKGSIGMVAGPSLPDDVYVRLNQQLEWAEADRSLEGLKSVWYSSQRYKKEEAYQQCFSRLSRSS